MRGLWVVTEYVQKGAKVWASPAPLFARVSFLRRVGAVAAACGILGCVCALGVTWVTQQDMTGGRGTSEHSGILLTNTWVRLSTCTTVLEVRTGAKACCCL